MATAPKDKTSIDGLDRVLVLEVARVTEAAAIAAARLRGRGNEKAADKAAVDAMRRELGRVHIHGRVVIGEGEMDESADALTSARRSAPATARRSTSPSIRSRARRICAKAMPNALAVLAIAERGGLLNAPDMYMNKIAIGPGYPGRHRRSRRPARATTSTRWPRPRACRWRRSRPASSTGRATPS